MWIGHVVRLARRRPYSPFLFSRKEIVLMTSFNVDFTPAMNMAASIFNGLGPVFFIVIGITPVCGLKCERMLINGDRAFACRPGEAGA